MHHAQIKRQVQTLHLQCDESLDSEMQMVSFTGFRKCSSIHLCVQLISGFLGAAVRIFQILLPVCKLLGLKQL